MSARQEGAHDTPDESGSQEPRSPERSTTYRGEDDLDEDSACLKKAKLESADHCEDAAFGSGSGGSNRAADPGDLPSCPDGFICDQTDESHAASFSHINRALGFYLTKCEGVVKKYNADTYTRSLEDILREDVGGGQRLVSAVHFSFVYDISWLLAQYPEKYRNLRMWFVAGKKEEELDPPLKGQLLENMTVLEIELIDFQLHHSKMICLEYEKSLRIIVTTANLRGVEWSERSQMVWVSPPLQKVKVGEGRDSPTGFRRSLRDYLKSYGKKELTDLAKSYEDYDYSTIQSYFIGSSPNRRGSGLGDLSAILEGNVCEVSNECPLTFSFSSAGKLGEENDADWFRSYFGVKLLSPSPLLGRDVTKSNIKPIYPCVKDMEAMGGKSLSYYEKTHKDQKWVRDWLHKWSADRTGRSKIMPHVKFYIRTSEDYEYTYWFLMSSANLSKPAWGQGFYGPTFYECGILHVPNKPIGTKDLVVPFDLPPENYGKKDEPALNKYSQSSSKITD